MSMYGGDNIRSNSVLFKERRNFDKRWPKCLCYWERELSCWNPSEIVTVLVHQGQCSDGCKLMYFLRAVWEAPHQRLFANAGRTNVCVCVCVTELLSVCSGGSETYRVNVAISSEAGERLITISRLCFMFGLDPVIFLFTGFEEASEWNSAGKWSWESTGWKLCSASLISSRLCSCRRSHHLQETQGRSPSIIPAPSHHSQFCPSICVTLSMGFITSYNKGGFYLHWLHPDCSQFFSMLCISVWLDYLFCWIVETKSGT